MDPSISLNIKYTILIILSLKMPRILQVSAANQYITDYKCAYNDLTLFCSNEAEKDISSKIQSSNTTDLCRTMPSSVRVNFANCDLPKLPNQSLGNFQLWELDASSISLEYLDTDSLANIKYCHGCSPQTMNLSSNHLTQIDQPVFTELRTLEFLDLSKNRIQSLSSSAFTGLIALNMLYLL